MEAFPSLKKEKELLALKGIDLEASFRAFIYEFVGLRTDDVILTGMTQAPRETLTEPEVSALLGMANGGTKKAVARALGKSPWTIADQLNSCCTKLGAINYTHAVALALCRGLIVYTEIEAKKGSRP